MVTPAKLVLESKRSVFCRKNMKQAERKAELKSSFVYEGQEILVEWFSVASKAEIPDLPWQQVYAIGELEGKVPIVHYDDRKDNLPGGHTEPGETLEQTLRREIREELNMRVLDWQPIGYQKCTEPDGEVAYQFRVFARLEKIGEFAGDVDGSVIGYSLINIDKLNSRIKYGNVGEVMAARAKEILKEE